MRILFIGNKQISQDFSQIIDNYDFIVRYNKMDNYGLTGTKTDLYCYFGNIIDFSEKIEAKRLNLIRTFSQIAVNRYWADLNKSTHPKEFRKLVPMNWEQKAQVWTDGYCKHVLGLSYPLEHFRHYQSAIRIILFLLAYYPEHSLSVTAMDLDRSYLQERSWHCYLEEEKEILDQFKQNFNYIPV